MSREWVPLCANIKNRRGVRSSTRRLTPTPEQRTTSMSAATPTPPAQWLQTYHPTQLSDVIGNVRLVRQLKEWLNAVQRYNRAGGTGDATRPVPITFLYGPSGIGKTTALAALASELNLEFPARDPAYSLVYQLFWLTFFSERERERGPDSRKRKEENSKWEEKNRETGGRRCSFVSLL